MRLGIAATLSSCNAEEWARKHAELGLRSVVWPLDYTAGESRQKEYLEAVEKYDLVIAEVGVWRNCIASDETERTQAMAYAIGQLALADRIGARCCVNIAGAPVGSRWDGAYKENWSVGAWNKTVDSIREIVDTVKPTRTKYAIEPMPWMIPSGPEEYLRLLRDINREAVGVHMDIVNMINSPSRYFNQESFLRECFELLGDQILSCHLKDIQLREEFTFQLEETACGKGCLPIELYAELATEQSLDMPMLIEHLTSEEDYIASVKYVRERLSISNK